MTTHPAAVALPFSVVRSLIEEARSRAAAAEQTGDDLNAHANSLMAEKLTEALMDQRAKMGGKLAELRRASAAENVQDRAAARVLQQQARDLEQQARDLAVASFDQLEDGGNHHL